MPYTLEIHQLDVGQGESALILVKGTIGEEEPQIVKSALIDGGRGFCYAEVLEPYLTRHLAKTKLDLAITSHYDGDHFKGIVELIRDGRFTGADTEFIDRGMSPGRASYSDYNRALMIHFARLLKEKAESEIMDDTLRNANYRLSVGKLRDFIFDPKVNEVLDQKWVEQAQVKFASLKYLRSKYKDWQIRSAFVNFSQMLEKWWMGNIPWGGKGYQELVGSELFGLKDGPKLTCVAMNRGKDDSEGQENQNSLAFLLCFNNFSFFTAGDTESGEVALAHPDYLAQYRADKERYEESRRTPGAFLGKPFGENYLAHQDHLGPQLSAFKVGHHGSHKSTDLQNFLDILKPSVALVSCGDNNCHDHPREDMLGRLDQCNSIKKVFLTTLGGKDRTTYVTYPARNPGDKPWEEEGFAVSISRDETAPSSAYKLTVRYRGQNVIANADVNLEDGIKILMADRKTELRRGFLHKVVVMDNGASTDLEAFTIRVIPADPGKPKEDLSYVELPSFVQKKDRTLEQDDQGNFVTLGIARITKYVRASIPVQQPPPPETDPMDQDRSFGCQLTTEKMLVAGAWQDGSFRNGHLILRVTDEGSRRSPAQFMVVCDFTADLNSEKYDADCTFPF